MTPYDWANGGSVEIFFTWWVWSYSSGVHAVLMYVYEILAQNYVVLVQGREM